MPGVRGTDGRPPTLGEIAIACGVSKATVSKSLNPYQSKCEISPAKRRSIRLTAVRMGWQPGLRRHWAGKRLYRAIAMVCAKAAPGLYGPIDGVDDAMAAALRGLGYQLLFMPILSGMTWRQCLRKQQVDGAILIPPLPVGLSMELACDGFPAVLWNADDGGGLPCVQPDDAGGIALAMSRLRQAGHRRIAYLKCFGENAHPSVGERLVAYRQAIADMDGIERSVALPDAAAIEKWLASGAGGATAMVTYRSDDAILVHGAATRLGLRLPRDLSLISADDHVVLAMIAPRVSAVRVPFHDLARRAAELVVDAVEGRPVAIPQPRMREILVERETIGPPRRQPRRRSKRVRETGRPG